MVMCLYGLPLAYGGYKRCNMSKLLKMCQQTNIIEDGQLEFTLGGKDNAFI